MISYRKLARLRFEPMTTEFCLDALTDWAIRPWVQLALRASFVQLLQFHWLFSVIYIYLHLYLYSNTSTANNISTEGNDTSVSFIQLIDESGNEVSPLSTSKRINGYFCSDNVFNLSKKVLNEIEIKVLEKGLGFVPTPNIINEEDLRRDFGEFSRKMRCKWYFRDELSPNFSEVPAFRPKSNWKPPPVHPCVELFLSKLERVVFLFVR